MGWTSKLYEGQNNAYNALVGRPLGKRPFRKPRIRWEDDIKKKFREIRCDGMAHDHAQWRTLVLAVFKFRDLLLDRYFLKSFLCIQICFLISLSMHQIE
jgi:hypothetical protein